MNYNTLRYFVVLAETEHYTQAAQKLFISQPSLSYAISNLEKELGVPLFEKSGRNIKLTRYGTILYNNAAVGMKMIEDGFQLIQQFSSNHTRNINFAFLFVLGRSMIPQLISRFKCSEEYSDIYFALSQNNTKVILDNIRNGTYDLGICTYVSNAPDILFTPILHHELVLIVPENHLLASRTEIRIPDILDYPLISYNSSCSETRQLIDSLFRPFSDKKPNIVYECEEETTIAALVEKNCGIAVVPNIETLNLFQLKRLSLVNTHMERVLYLAKDKNRILSSQSEIFYNYILSADLTSIF